MPVSMDSLQVLTGATKTIGARRHWSMQTFRNVCSEQQPFFSSTADTLGASRVEYVFIFTRPAFPFSKNVWIFHPIEVLPQGAPSHTVWSKIGCILVLPNRGTKFNSEMQQQNRGSKPFSIGNLKSSRNYYLWKSVFKCFTLFQIGWVIQ